MIGVSLFGCMTYVVVSSHVLAKEPSESEPVPLGATLTGTASGTTISAAPAVAVTVTSFHPNMTGDDAIKVVALTRGGSLFWEPPPRK
jgi:hypothetical protein